MLLHAIELANHLKYNLVSKELQDKYPNSWTIPSWAKGGTKVHPEVRPSPKMDARTKRAVARDV